VQKQLDDLRSRIERHRRRKNEIEARVAPKRNAVVECYRCVQALPGVSRSSMVPATGRTQNGRSTAGEKSRNSKTCERRFPTDPCV
jgi:hypothetical protein